MDNKYSVLVLGCGGFSRAALCALKQLGFQNISVTCRSQKKIEDLKTFFKINTINWDDRNRFFYDIIINATPIGMTPQRNQMPIDLYTINKSKLIIDAVVSPFRTMLIEQATLAGKKVIPGYKISLEQLVIQFMLYTGFEAPREVLEAKLKKLVDDEIIPNE
jgi:shikimate dehydrogenase